MIERDMAHLRFLQTRVMKGECLSNDDMLFVITKKAEFENVIMNLEDMMETIRQIEEMR